MSVLVIHKAWSDYGKSIIPYELPYIKSLIRGEGYQMKIEPISRIWIDKSNRLCIQPDKITFELIYRSAMGVQWNSENHYLFSQIMISWTPVDWFRQIISAVEAEYGRHLYITEKTERENINGSFRRLIEAESERHNTV